jgi:hypothetical protein
MEFVDYPGGTNINMSSLIPTAIQLFEHLEESRNPYSKMQILSKISDHVHKQLSLSIQDYEFDTFLAGLSFIIIQSQMPQLPSNIYFIKLFLINASSTFLASSLVLNVVFFLISVSTYCALARFFALCAISSGDWPRYSAAALNLI